MTWAPAEANLLGGTAIISTFENGKVRKHLLWRVLGLTAVRVGMYGVIAAIFLSMVVGLWPHIAKMPELTGVVYLMAFVGCLYLGFAVFFAIYAKIAMKLEAVELTDSNLKIQSGEKVVMAQWSEIKEVKVSFTSWWSVYYLGGIPGEKTPVIFIRTASWTHILEWWRYPAEERKQAFLYILRRVVPYSIPIVDDFNWVPAEYASYPRIIKGAQNEYEKVKKVGLYMIGIGTLLCLILMGIGYATGSGTAFTASAFAFAVCFIGIFVWVAGAAGMDEEKKKTERAKLQQP